MTESNNIFERFAHHIFKDVDMETFPIRSGIDTSRDIYYRREEKWIRDANGKSIMTVADFLMMVEDIYKSNVSDYKKYDISKDPIESVNTIRTIDNNCSKIKNLSTNRATRKQLSNEVRPYLIEYDKNQHK